MKKINDMKSYKGTKIILAFIGIENVLSIILQGLPKIDFVTIIVQCVFGILLYLGVKWIYYLFLLSSGFGFFWLFSLYNVYPENMQRPIIAIAALQLFCLFTFVILSVSKNIKEYFAINKIKDKK